MFTDSYIVIMLFDLLKVIDKILSKYKTFYWLWLHEKVWEPQKHYKLIIVALIIFSQTSYRWVGALYLHIVLQNT